MTKNLKDALRKQKKQTKQEILQITGSLGIPIGGQRRVEVPNRNSFVYVRLRDNENEVIQAFNNKVAPSYGLPVIVERQAGRYIVVSVDSLRYNNNYNSFSPFLPRHGNTHSFDLESGGGGDPVWVYSRQMMPALIMPSGSEGGPNVIMNAYTIKNDDGTWKYVGITGTSSFTPYKPPTGTQAVMVLVYLDALSGNPYLMVGSGSYFANTITGSAAIVPYIPTLTNPNHIPLAAVRLVSGTGAISWNNIYDIRQWIHSIPTGTGGGGGTGTNYDSTYLRLDASNDPVTGFLQLNAGLAIGAPTGSVPFVVQTYNAQGFIINQGGVGDGVTVNGAAASIQRTSLLNSSPNFSSPLLLLNQTTNSGTMSGNMISAKSDTVERLYYQPKPLSSGTYLYIDGDTLLSNDAPMLQLRNQGTLKTIFAGQGYLQFGKDVANQDGHAGKIGYRLFGSNYLEIVGAGTGTNARNVRIFDNLDVNFILTSQYFKTTSVAGDNLVGTDSTGLIVSKEAPNTSGTYGRKNNAWVEIPNPDSCKAARTTSQSINNGTDTRINLTSEYWDNNSMHDNATNNTRVTIKTAGKYIVNGYVVYAANATGIRSTQIYVNGAANTINTNNAVSSGNHQVSVSDQYQLAVNDYIELNVYQDSGGALNVDNASLAVTLISK